MLLVFRTPPFPNTPRPPHTPSRKTRAYRGSSTLTHSYRTPISRARRPRNAAMTSINVRARFPTRTHASSTCTHTHLRARLRKTRAPRMYYQCMASAHPSSPLPRSGSARSPKTAKSRLRDQSIAKFHLRDQRQQPASSRCRHGSGSGRAPGAVRLVPSDRFLCLKSAALTNQRLWVSIKEQPRTDGTSARRARSPQPTTRPAFQQRDEQRRRGARRGRDIKTTPPTLPHRHSCLRPHPPSLAQRPQYNATPETTPPRPYRAKRTPTTREAGRSRCT